jgi:hypothetical protein
MMPRIIPALASVVFLGFGTVHGQSSVPSAQQGAASHAADAQVTDLEALWRYAGSWHIETDIFDTPYSKVGKRISSLNNDCWRTAGYLACRQIVDGESKVLIVFSCGVTEHVCTSYQIPADGSPASDSTVHLEGDTWTFPWQTTDKDGQTTYFRVVNVWTSPTNIDYRQEYSTDQVRWTKTAVGHEVKTNSK